MENTHQTNETSLIFAQNLTWFNIPYPGKYGLPTFSMTSSSILVVGSLVNVIELVGDFYACARIAEIPSPPDHAIHRGLSINGLSSAFGCLFGSPCGLMTYSENIGLIGITKVSSRSIIYIAAGFMIIFGLIEKTDLIFSFIPHAIIGGIFIVTMGMVTAIGISNLQFVDLNSSRNLFIIGFSFFIGMGLPNYLQNNPLNIQIDHKGLKQILMATLSTSIFVGGASAFILDNILPGTFKERGFIQWKRQSLTLNNGGTQINNENLADNIYGWPNIFSRIRCGCQCKWARYVPFLPEFKFNCPCVKPVTENHYEEPPDIA